MLATDWPRVAGAPAELVRAACAISGVFELAPLLTTTMNRAMRLDAGTAVEASPLFWPPPGRGALVAAVGETETAEFHRQARAMVGAWASAGVATEYLSAEGVNHFTIIDELARPDSALFCRVVALTRLEFPTGFP
jgi:arylformamidase